MNPGWILAGAVLALLAGAACSKLRYTWLLLTAAGCLGALVAGGLVLVSAAAWRWETGWSIGGETVIFQLDAISSFFLVLMAWVGGLGAVYSMEYWSDRRHPRTARRGRYFWNGMLLTMMGLLTAGNGIHFLIGWESFTICAYFLITLDRQSRSVRSAGWLYLAASHAGTLGLFLFFAGMAAALGHWQLGPCTDHPEIAPLFWLALFGFGIKAGLFPLHVWLPSAHASAPSHVSALLSGVAIKMGIFGLVRFSGWMPLPHGAGWVVAGLGAASAVLGVAFALGQHDLKRLLAYHSVENIGIILLGLGFAMIASAEGRPAWGGLALVGGLLHVWNHGLFKALLFLGAGSVLHATGTRQMSLLGGLWRHLPWTAALFILGAAAISGLPPLNGFVSEWLVFQSLFQVVLAGGAPAWGAIPAAILLGLTGALALACFVKVCGIVFLGAPRSPAAEQAHEAGWFMRVPMMALAAGCLAIGLAPLAAGLLLQPLVMAWHPGWTPVPLETLGALGVAHRACAALALAALLTLLWRVRINGLSRSLTWDCGYAAPTARMQYTAGSFAAIITGWFDWILRPVRHEDRVEGNFPGRARFEEHTPETVLENIILPTGGVLMRVVALVRRLQHGRISAYILYLLAGVAVLALLAVLGGGQ